MRRRCLQFEEASLNTIENDDSSLNLANTVNCLEPPTSATELETSELCHVDPKATCSEQQTVNFPQSSATLLHPRYCEKLSVVTKSLGIGLHLNSVVNAAAMNCSVTASKLSADHNVEMQEMKSIMTRYNLLENTESCSTLVNAVEQLSACDGERNVDAKALIVASSATSELPLTVQEHCAAPDDNAKSNSQAADSLEYDLPSPRKKRSVGVFLFHIVSYSLFGILFAWTTELFIFFRKRAANNVSSEGCKRCNCKKSKCLKL